MKKDQYTCPLVSCSKLKAFPFPRRALLYISLVQLAAINGFYKLLFMNLDILVLVAPSQSNLWLKAIISVNPSSYLTSPQQHTILRGLNVKSGATSTPVNKTKCRQHHGLHLNGWTLFSFPYPVLFLSMPEQRAFWHGYGLELFLGAC